MVDAALVTDEASVESSFPGEQHQKPVGLFNPHFQQPERELQYRSYRLHDLQLVQVWGCGFVSLTLGFRLVWAAAHSFTPDSSVFGEHDARVVVSFLLATDFWLAVQMWLIYALQRLGRASHEMDTLEFAARRSSFQGDRRKKKVGEAACTQPTSRLYFLLGVYASVRYSFSKDRIVRLFGGELEVGDDGCRSRRSFETPLIFSLIIAHAYLSQLCRMKPGSFLLIAHLQLACYLGARAGLADAEGLNEDEGSAYYDAAALYVVLLIYYLSLRRTDLAHRREFVRLEQADFVSAEQRAKIAAAEERIVALRTPQLNETQQGALSKEFSDEAVPEQLRRVRIDFSELRVQKMLGCGTFGEVHRAEWRGTPVAVKMIRPSRINAAHLNAFKQECLLHLSMRHPNIVNLLGCAFEAQPGAEGHGQVCALLELCTRGTLEQLLESAQKLSWSAHKLPIALGVARAMAYLHAQAPPVIHRDLKTANVLIDDGFNPKLSDFGLSREATEDATMSTAGSPLFSAPELLRHERYDEQVDVWSYGCVLESLSTHKRTYDDCSELDEHGVRRPKQALVAEGVLRPTLPEGTFLADVLTRCVASDPEERPRFDGLVVELTQPELQLRAAMQPLKCNPALEAAEQRQARAAAAQLATYAPILPRPPPPLAPSLPVLLTPEEDLLAGTDLSVRHKPTRDRTHSPSTFRTPSRGSRTFGSGQLPVERSEERTLSENSHRELSTGHRRTPSRLALSVSALSMKAYSSRSILDVRGRRSKSIATAMAPGGLSDGSGATGGHKQRHGFSKEGPSPTKRECGSVDFRFSHMARRSVSSDSIRNTRSGDGDTSSVDGERGTHGPKSASLARLEDSFVTESCGSREPSLDDRALPGQDGDSPAAAGGARKTRGSHGFTSPLARSSTAPARSSIGEASRPPLAAIASSLSGETLERSGDCGTSVSCGLGISDDSDYGGLGGGPGPFQLGRISSVPVMSEESSEVAEFSQPSPLPASQPAAICQV